MRVSLHEGVDYKNTDTHTHTHYRNAYSYIKSSVFFFFFCLLTTVALHKTEKNRKGVRFDPDIPQTIRLEFAKSNTKVSKPKQQNSSPPAAAPHPTLLHPLTGREYLFSFFIYFFFLSRNSRHLTPVTCHDLFSTKQFSSCKKKTLLPTMEISHQSQMPWPTIFDKEPATCANYPAGVFLYRVHKRVIW